MKRFLAYSLLVLTLALLACWRLDTVTQTPAAHKPPPPEAESPRLPAAGEKLPGAFEDSGRVELLPDGTWLVILPRR